MKEVIIMAKIIFNLILLALICASLLYTAAHYFVKATENYIAKKKFDKLDLREAILIFPFLNMEDRSHHEFREDVFYYKFDNRKEFFNEAYLLPRDTYAFIVSDKEFIRIEDNRTLTKFKFVDDWEGLSDLKDIDKELFVLKRTKFAENLIGPIISYAPKKSKE